ncbi:hypothetical protein [Labilithrix luteola]|nr:hypothetical protein [Labilithrix luteola]
MSEPAGVAGIAAILEQARSFEGLNVATILGGSNITPEQMRAW